MQELRPKESYERMAELMNELSLYIMFGLGFILVRYVSEMLFTLLSNLLVPFLYDTRSDPLKPVSVRDHNSSAVRCLTKGGHGSLQQFLRERGYCHLTGAVQTYNTFLKNKGIAKNETPFNVLEHMKEQDLVPDIATHNTLLDLCFKEERIDVAMELFQHCCAPDSEVRPDVITFNIYIKGLLIRYNRGDKSIGLDAISQVIKNMAQLGIKPNDITYNTIIDLAVTMGQMKDAWAYFEEMKEKAGIAPDLFTYSILVKGLKETPCANKQNFDLLFDSIELYIAKHKEDIDEILFNSLIDTAVYYKDFSRVNQTLEHMKEHGIQPSNVTYGILIKAFGQNGMLDNALTIFEQMKHNHVEPNEVTYGCILDGCIRAGRFDEADRFLAEMRGKGIVPNIVIYTTMLKGYTKRHDFGLIWGLYEKIAIKREVEPNIVFYNAILEALAQCQRDDLLMTVYKQVLDEERTRALKLDIITYSTLIKGLCKAHHMDTVLGIYKELSSRRFLIDEVLYNSIMHGLLMVGKYAECQTVYQEMQTNKVQPSNVTYSIVVKLYSKTGQFARAVELFDSVVRDGKDPGVVFYTCVVQACIKSKQIHKAMEAFERFRAGSPNEVDQVMYNTIVNGCVYAGMLQKACTYTTWAIQDGVVLAADIYKNVLKNIVTSRTMGPAEKKLHTKLILQFLDENEIFLDDEIMGKTRRLLNDARTMPRRKGCVYVPKKPVAFQ